MAEKNHWDELIELRDRQRERAASAMQVVRGDALAQENTAFGKLRWYMHPSIENTALSTLMFFEQELAPGGRSGRLKFQGGQVVYVLAGSGYTLVDGVKHAWKTGDVLNLPIKRDGIIVQHVNTGEETATLLACEPNWFAANGVDRGSGFELLESASDYRG